MQSEKCEKSSFSLKIFSAFLQKARPNGVTLFARSRL